MIYGLFRDWGLSTLKLWTTKDAHQSAIFFVNGDGLVQHLGEDVDDAGNLVRHQLHHSCAIGQQHIKVSLGLKAN